MATLPAASPSTIAAAADVPPAHATVAVAVTAAAATAPPPLPPPHPIIHHRVLFTLESVGITRDTIRFKNVVLQSDRWIAVRNNTILQCITIGHPPSVMKLPVSVDAAVMHPSQKLIALRSAAQLQVYNLEMKTKVAATMMDLPHGDSIVFWKWLHDGIIMVVTTSAIYHWHTHQQPQPPNGAPHQQRSSPVRIFDRLASPTDDDHNTPKDVSASYVGPNQQQVVNGGCSDDQHWHYVVALSSRHGGGIRGHLHIYNSDLAASQPEIDATTAIISRMEYHGRSRSVIAFVGNSHTQPHTRQITIMELVAPSQRRDPSIRPIIVALPSLSETDFVVHLVADAAYLHVIWAVSRNGVIVCVDVAAATIVAQSNLSFGAFFTAVASLPPKMTHINTHSNGNVNGSGGILAIAATGEVVRIKLGEFPPPITVATKSTSEIKTTMTPTATAMAAAAAPPRIQSQMSTIPTYAYAAHLPAYCLKSDLSDIEFICQEELNDSKLVRVPAHRLLVANASSSLRALVTSSAVVRNTSPQSSSYVMYEYVMDRDSMRARALQSFLHFIYTSFVTSPSLPLLLQDIPCLKIAAVTYGLPSLTVALADAELHMVTIDTAIDAINLGLGRNFVCGHIATLVDHPSWLRLTKPALKSLLDDDALAIHELPLFMAVLRWAHAQYQIPMPAAAFGQGDGILVDVLPLIRFPLLPIQHFASVVAPSGVLSNEAMVQLYSFIATPIYDRDPNVVPYSSRVRAPAPSLSAALLASVQQHNGSRAAAAAAQYRSTATAVSSAHHARAASLPTTTSSSSSSSPYVDEVPKPPYPLLIRTASTPAPSLPMSRPPPMMSMTLPAAPLPIAMPVHVVSKSAPVTPAAAGLPPRLPSHGPPPPPPHVALPQLPRVQPPQPPISPPPAAPLTLPSPTITVASLATPSLSPSAKPLHIVPTLTPHREPIEEEVTSTVANEMDSHGAPSLSLQQVTPSSTDSNNTHMGLPCEQIPSAIIPDSARSYASSVESTTPWRDAMAAATPQLQPSPDNNTNTHVPLTPSPVFAEELKHNTNSSTPSPAPALSSAPINEHHPVAEVNASSTNDENTTDAAPSSTDEFDFPDH